MKCRPELCCSPQISIVILIISTAAARVCLFTSPWFAMENAVQGGLTIRTVGQYRLIILPPHLVLGISEVEPPPGAGVSYGDVDRPPPFQPLLLGGSAYPWRGEHFTHVISSLVLTAGYGQTRTGYLPPA